MPISPGAASNKVRHHAVEPDRGQDQRQNAEEAGERAIRRSWLKLPATCASSERRSMTVRLGSMPASVWRISASTLSGGDAEVEDHRVDEHRLRLRLRSSPVLCSRCTAARAGRRYTGRTGSRGLFILKSRKTPTISHAPEYFWKSMPKCWPIGFWLGKNLLTKVSLTSATCGEVAVS